jgi:hypothetical protein
VLALVIGGAALTDLTDPAVLIGLLLVTPLAFAVVVAPASSPPRPSRQDLIGERPIPRFLLGVAIGLAAWLAATALEVALAAL